MPDISKIKLPSGTVYDIKDAVARQTLAGAIKIKGSTTTALTDESTTNPVKINSANYTASANDAVFYNKKEFVFDGTKWHEFGDMSGLGTLATMNGGSIKPEGSVPASGLGFSGKSSTVTITATANNSGNYQPAGSVSTPSFTGKASTFSGTFTPAGSVNVSISSTTDQVVTVTTTATSSTNPATYTPGGSVGTPTFTGTTATITSSATYTPAGSVSLTNTDKSVAVTTASTSSSNPITYTPGGSVGTPTISVDSAGATGTFINSVTAKNVVTALAVAAPGATAPANAITYYSVGAAGSDEAETLCLYQIGATKEAAVTTGTGTAKTGDATYKSSKPSWTGTGVRLVTGNIAVPTSAAFSGTTATITSSASYKPAGTNSKPSWTGTGVRLVTAGIAVPSELTASFSGEANTVSVSGTPNGENGGITFTGTKVQLSGSTVASGSITGTATLSGTTATYSVVFTQ